MTSRLYDIIINRQNNCDYRKIIAVPSYGLTEGKTNGYANISLYATYNLRIWKCLKAVQEYLKILNSFKKIKTYVNEPDVSGS